MKKLAILGSILAAVVLLASLAIAIPVSAQPAGKVVAYDIYGDVTLDSDGSVILTSDDPGYGGIYQVYEEPIPLAQLKDWDIRMTAAALSGENQMQANGWSTFPCTDLPYFKVWIKPSADAAWDGVSKLTSTGTCIPSANIGVPYDIVGNGEGYDPANPYDPHNPRWQLCAESDSMFWLGLEEYPYGDVDWWLTLPDLIDLVLELHPDAVFIAVGVQNHFGSWNPEVQDQVWSVVVNDNPIFPCATSNVIVLRETGVLNWGQANSLLQQIDLGVQRAYEKQVEALYKGGMLSEVQRDGLLNALFH